MQRELVSLRIVETRTSTNTRQEMCYIIVLEMQIEIHKKENKTRERTEWVCGFGFGVTQPKYWHICGV